MTYSAGSAASVTTYSKRSGPHGMPLRFTKRGDERRASAPGFLLRRALLAAPTTPRARNQRSMRVAVQRSGRARKSGAGGALRVAAVAACCERGFVQAPLFFVKRRDRKVVNHRVPVQRVRGEPGRAKRRVSARQRARQRNEAALCDAGHAPELALGHGGGQVRHGARGDSRLGVGSRFLGPPRHRHAARALQSTARTSSARIGAVRAQRSRAYVIRLAAAP